MKLNEKHKKRLDELRIKENRLGGLTEDEKTEKEKLDSAERGSREFKSFKRQSSQERKK